MKKLLALVLALVMVMGLATVSSNAAFTDADSINYKEAVDVMSAIGVLQGNESNAYDPSGTLDRESAAKIIAYMILGKAGADSMSTASAPFSDIEATRWSAGAIAYCASEGIISGNGAGQFLPSTPLTGYAFAKMCLVALGYDAAREGLTGSDWQINVAKLVNQLDLANGLGSLVLSDTVTRQQAAQMAFNTLTKDMVEYVGGMSVVAGDVSVTNNVRATSLANTAYTYLSTGAGASAGAGAGGTMQFCENYFPTLKLVDGSTNGVTNDFGVTIDRWFLANSRTDYTRTDAKTIATVETDDAKATYTTNVGDITNGELYTLAGNNAITYTVNENGGAGTTGIAVTKGSSTKGLAGYKGATVKVFDTTGDGKADTIDVEYGYLAKVTKVTAATSSKNRYITMEVYNKLAKTTGVTFETEDFAKDDYVLVYPKGTITTTRAWLTTNNANEFNASGNIIKVEAAQSVNGTVSGISGSNGANVTAITAAGTKYTVGAATLGILGATAGTDTVATTTYGLGNGYTLYLANGYVLGVVGDSVGYSDYVYVAAASADNSGLVAYDTVTYVTQDGVVHTAKQVGTTISSGTLRGWFTIEEDSSNEGYHTFTAKATTAATLALSTGTALKSNTPTIATGITANSATIFMMRTGTTTFKMYTGISKVGNWTGATAANTRILTDAGDNTAGTAKLVYVDVTGGNNDSASDTPIFLIKLNGSTRIDNKNYFTYDAIVDGELTTVTSASSTLLSGLAVGGTAGNTYGALVIPTFDSNNYLTNVTLTGTDTLGDTTTTTKYLAVDSNSPIAYSSGTLRVGGTAYTLADSASIYYYETDATELKTTVDDIVGTVTGIIYLQFASTTDSTVKAVYVSGTIA